MENGKDKKSKYTAPSLIKVGMVNKKTLGSHPYRYDSMSGAASCMDKDGNAWDPCYVAHHS